MNSKEETSLKSFARISSKNSASWDPRVISWYCDINLYFLYPILCEAIAATRREEAVMCVLCLRVEHILEEEPGAELDWEEGRQSPDLPVYHRPQALPQIIILAHFTHQWSWGQEIPYFCNLKTRNKITFMNLWKVTTCLGRYRRKKVLERSILLILLFLGRNLIR